MSTKDRTPDLKTRILLASRALDAVPAGYKTASQWAKVFGLGPARTTILLRQGVENRVMTSRVFRIVNGNRGIYPVLHYKEL